MGPLLSTVGDVVLVGAGSAPTLDIDATVLIQAFFFILMWFVLSRTVFRPYLDARAEREQRTDGAREEARDARERADQVLSEYESALAKVRAEASKKREVFIKEGSSKASALTGDARKDADAELSRERERIAKEMSAARAELGARADVLSNVIVEKLVA